MPQNMQVKCFWSLLCAKLNLTQYANVYGFMIFCPLVAFYSSGIPS